MEKKKSKVDMNAMDRVTRKVLAFQPSKHRKKKRVGKKQGEEKPPS